MNSESFKNISAGLKNWVYIILVVVIAYICWGFYIVFTKYSIPDFPVWLAAFLAALYGFNTTDIKIGGK